MKKAFVSWISVICVLLICFLNHSHAQTCESYTGKICLSYIDYPIFVGNLPQAVYEGILEGQGVGNLTAIANKVHPPCANAALEYICAGFFPRCKENLTEPLPACKSVCHTFEEHCTSLLLQLNRTTLIPDCAQSIATGSPYPETNCEMNRLSSSLSEIAPDFKCPDPLIRDPQDGPVNPETSCFGLCCIPCPSLHYLYPEGLMTRIDNLLLSLSIISLILATFVLVSYLSIKQKRSYPAILITFTSIGLVIFFFSALLSIGDTQKVRCLSSITPAYPGYNTNHLCRAQSIFVIYGVLCASCWYFCLVMNIHMIVVWGKKDMDRYFWVLNVFSWGAPLIPIIIYNSANKNGYVVGMWCTIEKGGYLTGNFMVPLAILIFSSLILNIVTLYKIFVVAKDRNAKLSSIIKLQVRPFLFVFTIVTIFMFYWLYFEVQLSQPGSEEAWTQEWATCILLGNGQNQCSEISVPNLPNIPLYVFTESIVHLLGAVIFAFFGFRLEILHFWIALATGKEYNMPSYYANSSLSKSNIDLNTTPKEEKSKDLEEKN